MLDEKILLVQLTIPNFFFFFTKFFKCHKKLPSAVEEKMVSSFLPEFFSFRNCIGKSLWKVTIS